jgi:prepilin-type N-terminal cleavage/methylation domain-containing protein
MPGGDIMKNRNGQLWAFTFIEVMVSVAIFGIFAAGTLSLINLQFNIIRVTRERQYVSHILESRLEEIRDLTYEQIDELENRISFTPHPAITIFGREVNPEAINNEYVLDLYQGQGIVVITQVTSDIKRITVEVSWCSGGKNKPVSMGSSTLITRDGLNRL